MKLHIDIIEAILNMKSGSIRFSDGELYYTAVRDGDYIIIYPDVKKEDIELDEEKILDLLDKWGYREGNMMKCNDDDFRKIAHAIAQAKNEIIKVKEA